MVERKGPTREDVNSHLKDRRNRGRWGKDNEVGESTLVSPGALPHI